MKRIGDMPLLLLFVFRFVRLLLSGHQAVAIENAALRMQTAAFQRKRKRPRLTTLDRIFGSLSAGCGPIGDIPCFMSRQTPSSVGSANGSANSGPGCPTRSGTVEVAPAQPQNSADLIEQIAVANPLWRGPRIHGELKMLGVAIFERTVSRILRRLRLNHYMIVTAMSLAGAWIPRCEVFPVDMA